MTKSSSSDLRKEIMSVGIPYLPADQVFYKSYLYKIELSPKFKGLGGVSGKKVCKLDISNPSRARKDLAEFNTLMDKIISNVEYRAEMKEFISNLPDVEYKTRMGGENNLFYFRDPDVVMLVVGRYKDVINSVTGPINTEHEGTLDEVNIIMRDRLYFNKFRYYIEFERTDDFVGQDAPQLWLYLQSINRDSWREHKLQSIMKFYDIHGSLTGNPRGNQSMILNGVITPIQVASNNYGYSFPPRSVSVYLSDPNDYVYIKLMVGEHIKKSHEVVLFDELT